MNLWLIVPIKPFIEGKSRLAYTLPPSERTRLSRQLFRHVITQALGTTVLSGILVVSRDPTVLDGIQTPHLHQAPQLHYVAEEGFDLNQAIHQGRQEAIRRGADAILILPADLPRLQSKDIALLYEQALDTNGIVIVPSEDNGTNALLVRPPHLINFAFGRNSFLHHCLAAQLVNLPCRIVDSPHLRFDVDLPTDLTQLGNDRPYASYVNASSPQAWR